MANTLRPASLRQSQSLTQKALASPLMLAAAAIGIATPLCAQQTSAILLPTIDVETAAPETIFVPKKLKKRKVATKAPPAPTTTPAPVATPVAEAGKAGLSPYADPQAGYRAVTSANSLLGQPLLETARTVTAVTRDVLEDKNSTSIRELARTTPGMTLGTGEGGNAFGDVLFIRGFKASNDTFIDGVRDAGVAVRETFMAEQVEITKGPSGSIAGRGTTGGALNLVTKKPQDSDFTETQSALGSNGLVRQTVDWNKVWNDRFKTRVGAMSQVAEVAGRNGASDDRRGLSLAAEYKATERLTLSFDAYHLEMDQMPDWGVPWDATNGVPFTEAASNRPTLDRNTYYGVADRDFQDGQQDIATFGLAYDLGDGAKLTNRTRLGRTVNDYVLTAPERPVISALNPLDWTLTASPKGRYQVNSILANRTELTFAPEIGGRKHNIAIGLDVSEEEVEQRGYTGQDSENGGGSATNVLTGCSVTIFNPDTSGCWDSADLLVRSATPTITKVETQSLYASDTIDLSEQLILNMGLRLDHYDISRSGVDRSNVTYVYGRNDTMVNGNLGLTWKPRENATVYLAYATSSNPMGQELDGGGGDYAGLDANSQLLEPEQNTSLELGTKWQLGNLMVTGALFQTIKDQARETVGTGPSATTGDTGKYQVTGIELGVAGNVTDKLSVWGGATMMESEILESADVANQGMEFANIAHEQFNLLAKYQVTDKLSIGGQATWRGKIQGGTFAASNGNELPSYWRLDAMADYEIQKNASLSLRVDNLTDELYYDAFYRSGTPYVYVAPGRSVSLSLKVKF
jgi:catecholate siderophore receptor